MVGADGPPMTLTPSERQNSIWRKLVKHYTEQLVILREKNDRDMVENERGRLLGEIGAIKTLLAMDTDLEIHGEMSDVGAEF